MPAASLSSLFFRLSTISSRLAITSLMLKAFGSTALCDRNTLSDPATGGGGGGGGRDLGGGGGGGGGTLGGTLEWVISLFDESISKCDCSNMKRTL
jgi:hypothetical protein